jgi:hypothetical protein
VRALRLWVTLFEAPAYPSPAHFEQHPIAIVGEIDDDGAFHTLLGALHGKPGSPGARLDLPARPGGWAGAELIYYRDDLPARHELGPIVGDSVDLSRLDGNPLYLVAVIEGTPWLLGSFGEYRW